MNQNVSWINQYMMNAYDSILPNEWQKACGRLHFCGNITISPCTLQLMDEPSIPKDKLKISSAKSLTTSPSVVTFPLPPSTRTSQFQKTVLSLPQAKVAEQLALYEWRGHTELPIVKVSHCHVAWQTKESCEVEIQVEHFPARLEVLKELPLFKQLYLLKESLVGFERLSQKFGAFLVSPRMIVVDHAGRCRVWVNEDFASNECVSCKADQDHLVASICELVERTGNRHRTTRQFWEEMKNNSTFCSALSFIDNYTKTKRITVPNSLKLAQNDMSPQGKIPFNGSMTMNHAPTFIASLRSSLKHTRNNSNLDFTCIREKQENVEEKMQNKKVVKSDLTTLPSNFEYGLEAEDQFLFQNLLDQQKPIVSEPLVRLHHKPSQETNGYRKLSEQFMSINSNVLAPPARNITKTSISNRKWDKSNFLNCEVAEYEQRLDSPKWQGFSSLWEGGQLKKSIYAGKEQREAHRFQLLGNLGKSIKESFIQEEMESSSEN